jgi:alpha-L-rhamnosidase
MAAMLFACAGSAAPAAPATLQPVNLRCEYRADPLGIDIPRPRLSWTLEAGPGTPRGLRQSACQVLVASSRERLAIGHGDRWDSGRVQSDQSVHVLYEGKELASHEEVFWKVRVWDQDGGMSAWSIAGRWSMGILSPAAWNATWIGLDQQEEKNALAGVEWIWFPEGNPAEAAPIGQRFFRRTITLPAAQAIKEARFGITADNEFVLYVNGQQAASGNNFHAVTEVNVAPMLRPGANCFAVVARNTGASPNPAGMAGLLRIEFIDAEPLVVSTVQTWKSSDTAGEGWAQTGYDDSLWPPARSLGPVGMAPWGQINGPDERSLPSRYLRKEIVVDRPVRRAVAYVSGLGLSELHINGQKAGDHVLSPGLTEYPKRVFYVTHDVTRMLRPGTNAIGVILGNGRYFAPRLKVPTDTITFGYPKLLLHLRVEHDEGPPSEWVSDTAWRLTTDGPIRANNEYDGEDYDARRELAGWSRPGYNDEAWQPAERVTAPGGVLAAQMPEPIRVVSTLKPISVTQPKPGMYVFDLGQNMVGWCRLRVTGPRGTIVRLRHAEVLRPDGTLYLDNIRSARVTDSYVLHGAGAEVYEPRFTYHGFRYVELTGFPGQPDLTVLEGRVVNDAVERAGEFTTSNQPLNQLYRNVRWGVQGNYRSLPTDCPQRDERQGWLGDRSAESKGETYLFHTAALYSKWLQDMEDAQRPTGSVPDVAPAYWPFYSDNVTWPSSTVIIPGSLLEQYGDTTIIARHYPSMRKWIDYMAGFIKDDLMPRDTYGDWCVPPEEQTLIHSQDPKRKTARAVLGTCYFYHDLRWIERYATLLGQTDDARRFGELADRLKAGFNRAFLKPELGQYDNGSQTSCVLPLAFGLVPPEHRQRVFAHLVDKITHESRGHVGTGLIGGQWLMRVLSDQGRTDLAYTLATQQDYPSWGYMASKGATTVWELWNGDTADPAMNSGNHVMLVGDLVIWMHEYLAGIKPDPDNPGFRHILMRPHPVGDLQYVKATHRSPYGWVASEWRKAPDRLEWNVTVPPNTMATLSVPARQVAGITEAGRPVREAPGLRFLRLEPGYAVFLAGSGRYAFSSSF